MTQTVTTGDGRAYVFITVDHCSGEFIGTCLVEPSRWEALEPVRQGVTQPFGGVTDLDVATGPDPAPRPHGSVRHGRRLSTRSGASNLSSPAFVRQPEGNGVAERAIRTLRSIALGAARRDRRGAAAGAGTPSQPNTTPHGSVRHGYIDTRSDRAEQKALEPEKRHGGRSASTSATRGRKPSPGQRRPLRAVPRPQSTASRPCLDSVLRVQSWAWPPSLGAPMEYQNGQLLPVPHRLCPLKWCKRPRAEPPA